MKHEKQNIAVILAGGSGNRMGGTLPKQFLMLGGKTVLEHAVEAFEKNPNIREIAVVCAPEWKAKVEELAARNAWTKLKKILPGGKERYRSTLSAVEAYRNTPNVNLIFHDAARPLVSQRIIDGVTQALKTHRAVDVALPCTDTILQVKDGFIQGVPDRNTLMRSQTPQAFSLEIIAKAYDIALTDKNFSTTDDCGTVLRYLPEIPIFIVPGDECNLKLTHPKDLPVLERLVQTK
ncbi:MAG: 2-C-methyl-D-erythritol 4-phosphate cytidylyltransferase [Bacteroides sp.]|nr:2-C-methyl-D-erythritol 4-phosphate cytidylyltransferase [Bacteroides sp.]MCM1086499.1 2-C-methyl-D-erythritol 4-phosphate cytidylyltransferase [Bacteroides sp.]